MLLRHFPVNDALLQVWIFLVLTMPFMWLHLCVFVSYILTLVLGNFIGITVIDNQDHYAIVKVGGGKYEDFMSIDCSKQIFEQGYYDDGTACKNVNILTQYVEVILKTRMRLEWRLETDAIKPEMAKNYHLIKRSTIFALLQWNFVKMPKWVCR